MDPKPAADAQSQPHAHAVTTTHAIVTSYAATIALDAVVTF